MQGSVRKRGEKWYYSFEVAKTNGKRNRIERVGGKTKKEAEKALREAIQNYESAGRHTDESNISFEDVSTIWMDEYVRKNLKYRTEQSYEIMLRKQILPYLGKYKMKSITPAVINEYVLGRRDDGLSKNYLLGLKGVLNSILKYAVFPYYFNWR